MQKDPLNCTVYVTYRIPIFFKRNNIEKDTSLVVMNTDNHCAEHSIINVTGRGYTDDI